jgi:hypothetical protein
VTSVIYNSLDFIHDFCFLPSVSLRSSDTCTDSFVEVTDTGTDSFVEVTDAGTDSFVEVNVRLPHMFYRPNIGGSTSLSKQGTRQGLTKRCT